MRSREGASDNGTCKQMRQDIKNEQPRKRTDPKVMPIDHSTVNRLNARAMFVSSDSSPSMLFITPTFPFNNPVKHRLAPVEKRQKGSARLINKEMIVPDHKTSESP
jgi:hypothetical protein